MATQNNITQSTIKKLIRKADKIYKNIYDHDFANLKDKYNVSSDEDIEAFNSDPHDYLINLQNQYKKSGENKKVDNYDIDFLSYLKQDQDLFKILILFINAPSGLNKYIIGHYLKADLYTYDDDGSKLSAEKKAHKISKNLNYVENNVAHLSALLCRFFPDYSNALYIEMYRANTKAQAFWYRFKNYDQAKKLFPYLLAQDSVLSLTPTISKKERMEIAQDCMDDLVRRLSLKDDKQAKRITSVLKHIIKAIKTRTLCKLYTADASYFFLPLMIRDVSENAFESSYGKYDENYSPFDSLYKYIAMNSSYGIIGLTFDGEYQGMNAEWHRKSSKAFFNLEKITKVTLTSKLSEKGLKLSEDYCDLSSDLYYLNPYRNLWGEDFYLLLPKNFYNEIPNNIRYSFFNLDGSNPKKVALSWLKKHQDVFNDSFLSESRWNRGDIESFNVDYFSNSTDYQLVKCKNYLELISKLNTFHLILPQNTLPRELVDRQHIQFVESLIDRKMIASPHHELQNEKEVVIDSGEIADSKDVFNESENDYYVRKRNEYLSKFRYNDLSILESPFSSFFFCRSLCDITLVEDLRHPAVGIPLCISDDHGTNYLIYWEYEPLLKKLSALESYQPKDGVYKETEILNSFIKETGLKEDTILKISEDLTLDFACVKLSSVDSIFNFCEFEADSGNKAEFSSLDDEAYALLKQYATKELNPNPKLDELTFFTRNYTVFFDKNDYREALYLPDSFSQTRIYSGITDFLKEQNLPQKLISRLNSVEPPVHDGSKREISFLSFRTCKRSDVIRFLHEHMGRVFYLDMSEDSSDPLRIYEELKADNEKLKSMCDLK